MTAENPCSVANAECIAPAGYLVGSGMADGTKSARGRCVICTEPVCSKCSVTRGRRRICDNCLPDALIASVRKRGCKPAPESVRDAAHEAFHALESDTRGKWEREHVHRAFLRKHKRIFELWREEMRARVIEQEVCKRLGVNADGTLEYWVGMSVMEAIKFGQPYADIQQSLLVCEKLAQQDETKWWVERVLALAGR